MQIPVFVSCPTALSPRQEAARKLILRQLAALGLEPRALGRSDYPTDFPLREVQVIAKHCSGGVILGFQQFHATRGEWKPDTTEARKVTTAVSFPSPWNQLEAGILFSLQLPLLIFREPTISGGIFDAGTSEAFVHRMPGHALSKAELASLTEVFRKWQASVRAHYYR